MGATNYLTDTELDMIRQEVLFFLPDQCYVQRKTYTKDAYHNSVEDFSTETGPHYCRFAKLDRVEGVFGGQAFEREMSKVWYTVFMKIDVEVDLGDRLKKDSEVYEIVRVYNEHTNQMVKSLIVTFLEGDNG